MVPKLILAAEVFLGMLTLIVRMLYDRWAADEEERDLLNDGVFRGLLSRGASWGAVPWVVSSGVSWRGLFRITS